jgi:hypothetical protein
LFTDAGEPVFLRRLRYNLMESHAVLKAQSRRAVKTGVKISANTQSSGRRSWKKRPLRKPSVKL